MFDINSAKLDTVKAKAIVSIRIWWVFHMASLPFWRGKQSVLGKGVFKGVTGLEMWLKW
jgi:hypothetical protein